MVYRLRGVYLPYSVSLLRTQTLYSQPKRTAVSFVFLSEDKNKQQQQTNPKKSVKL